MLSKRLAQPLLELGYLVTGVVVGSAVFTVTVLVLALGFGLLPLMLLGLPVLIGGVHVVRAMATFERARAAFLLGEQLPVAPVPVAPRGRPVQQLVAHIRSPELRREVAYCLLLLPVAALAAAVAVPLWSGALAGLLLPLYAGWLPDGSTVSWVGLPVGWAVAAGFVAGLLLTVLALAVTPALARKLVRFAALLLSPRPSDALRARISRLSETRARVVDAADAERRRIERDLHDGAQQHLVALAMNLGRAKAKFDDDPTGARALVDQAHEEAKESITALRNVVRGVHPAVLTDRGLDAALSALASRSPVPVRLTVDVAVRPAPVVEAIAYFVVSEALTNIARHSGAEAARVDVRSDVDGLSLVVSDDGRGGATERADGGLIGLRDRVAAVDGSFSVNSRPGGGTVVTAEVPHARSDR